MVLHSDQGADVAVFFVGQRDTLIVPTSSRRTSTSLLGSSKLGAISESRPHAPPASAVERSLNLARQALLAKQDPAGYWAAELQGDSILESEYILLKFILSQEDDPHLPLIANYLRRLQQPDGGWNMFPGGANDLSGTVKGYFALKLMGDDPDAPHMRQAREVIRALGGAENCNSFTKFYLAALGQVSYDTCPSIPPEIMTKERPTAAMIT